MSSSFLSIAVSVTCIKLLFITAYRSTDFEVHRNWLAITHSLPSSKWYFENTSEWTLDYPPLFAWFEYVLSQAARLVDPRMLEVANLSYASSATIYFQRLTVILSDLFLIYAVWVWRGLISPKKGDRSSKHDDPWLDKTTVVSMLFLWNPGLLLVDHVHFQYNGFLHGILLLSTARLFQGRCVEATLWFTILLNLKHIYLYVAPVFFVYLLRNYCFAQSHGKTPQSLLWRFQPIHFLRLAGTVLLVFAVSLWPFLSKAQLMQMLQRLFPFKRGLCHAYWAPNWWALYAATDRVLAFAGLGSGKSAAVTIASPTSGLVQDTNFTLLPNVPPLCTFILTALFQLPTLWGLWKRPQEPWLLVRALVLCSLSAFLFGWHVHEKAILMPVLLATPLALCSSADAAMYVILSAAGHASLFPLLFRSAEMPAKVLLVLLHAVYAMCTLGKLHSSKVKLKRRYTSEQVARHTGMLLSWFEQAGLCLLGLAVVVYGELLHPFTPLAGRMPFLPLMVTSVSCSVAIIYAWAKSWQLWFLQPSRDI
ncbi:ALG6/ALG8 family glucosyltransferase xit [Dermacentor variabilis]|uniref:ALG6/ALG8 family glucosyltransferase xit n=1 Tax=Dermacentor variabilis TaxID=34621 RepID=UPI003F5BC164